MENILQNSNDEVRYYKSRSAAVKDVLVYYFLFDYKIMVKVLTIGGAVESHEIKACKNISQFNEICSKTGRPELSLGDFQDHEIKGNMNAAKEFVKRFNNECFKSMTFIATMYLTPGDSFEVFISEDSDNNVIKLIYHCHSKKMTIVYIKKFTAKGEEDSFKRIFDEDGSVYKTIIEEQKGFQQLVNYTAYRQMVRTMIQNVDEFIRKLAVLTIVECKDNSGFENIIEVGVEYVVKKMLEDDMLEIENMFGELVQLDSKRFINMRKEIVQ